MHNCFVLIIVALVSNASTTSVSIQGVKFFRDNQPLNKGSTVEGLLLNTRMIQAVFDDENSKTVGMWNYPDTGTWDPDRNVDEFVGNISSYVSYNINAMTVGMQGGDPHFPVVNDTFPYIVSGFNPNGSFKEAWLARMKKVLSKADEEGLVVIFSLYYLYNAHILRDETAVYNGIRNAIDFLIQSNYTNILLEIANESYYLYPHRLLRPENIHILILFAKRYSNDKLLVSASFRGGILPPPPVLEAVDYITVHGNSMTPEQINEFIVSIKSQPGYLKNPRPIVFNEDSTRLDNFAVALSQQCGWGYYDQGQSNYKDGFQSPPVNWNPEAATTKLTFFKTVKAITETNH